MFAKTKASVIWQADWRHRTYIDTRKHVCVCARALQSLDLTTNMKSLHFPQPNWFLCIFLFGNNSVTLVLENVKLLPVVKLQPIISLQLAGWSAATVSCGKKSSLLFRRSFLSHTLLMLENPKTLCYRPVSFLLMSSCSTPLLWPHKITHSDTQQTSEAVSWLNNAVAQNAKAMRQSPGHALRIIRTRRVSMS